MWTMLAWISTPDIAPTGVAWASRLSAKVAPTSTTRPRNGLSAAGSTERRAASTMAPLGNVIMVPAGPAKSIRHVDSRRVRTSSGSAGPKAPCRSSTGRSSAPPSSASAAASDCSV